MSDLITKKRRTEIYVTTDVANMATQAWAAVARLNSPVHLVVFAGRPNRLAEDGTLTPLNVDLLLYEVNRAVDFMAVDPKGRKHREKASRDVIVDMLAFPEAPLPVLEIVRYAPCFDGEGNLCALPGFYPKSGIYLAPCPALPKLPTVKEAIELLDDLFIDFPFATEADRANILALTLTPFVRAMIDGPTPIYLIGAPSPGTGKGLASESALTIAFGKNAYSMVTPSNDENELRKLVTTLLRRAVPAILFDNVETLAGATISSLATASVWHDRILGGNTDFSTPVRWTVAVNGNNVAMSAEVARRIVPIRIVAKVDKPWERSEFKHPILREWVLDNLPQLQAACIAIVDSWLKAGRPAGRPVNMGSFEAYTKVLSGILEHVGVEGFLTNRNALFETADTLGAAWRDLVHQWAERIRNRSLKTNCSTGEVFDIAVGIDGFDLEPGRGNAEKTRFGMALAKRVDMIMDGYCIKKGTRKNGLSTWTLEKEGPWDLEGPSTTQVHNGEF